MEKISIAYWGSGRVTTFKWHSVGCSCFQTPARMGWTADDIPSQEGRVVLVTGANSGLGLESARALYKKGATVVMACRSEERARKAMADIEDSCKGTKGVGKLEFLQMDTSEPDSGRERRSSSRSTRSCTWGC